MKRAFRRSAGSVADLEDDLRTFLHLSCHLPKLNQIRNFHSLYTNVFSYKLVCIYIFVIVALGEVCISAKARIEDDL
jgi:hypothetical protein